MTNLLLLLLCPALTLLADAQSKPTDRPHITAIDHVSFYTTAPDGVKHLYVDILGLPSAAPIESGETVRYMSGKQWVGYSPAPDPKATDRMDHVAFTTDNIAALRRYLTEKGIQPTQIEDRSPHSLAFSVNDPERHHIEFVERPPRAVLEPSPSAVS